MIVEIFVKLSFACYSGRALSTNIRSPSEPISRPRSARHRIYSKELVAGSGYSPEPHPPLILLIFSFESHSAFHTQPRCGSLPRHAISTQVQVSIRKCCSKFHLFTCSHREPEEHSYEAIKQADCTTQKPTSAQCRSRPRSQDAALRRGQGHVHVSGSARQAHGGRRRRADGK